MFGDSIEMKKCHTCHRKIKSCGSQNFRKVLLGTLLTVFQIKMIKEGLEGFVACNMIEQNYRLLSTLKPRLKPFLALTATSYVSDCALVI